MTKSEIEQLEKQGCFSQDWSQISISKDTDLRRIRNVYFSGPVTIGACAEIINVPGGLSNVRIGDNVRIINVARIENSPQSSFGVGTDVAVLDETGGRPVRIYPGISAQVASLAARMPEYAKSTLLPLIDKHIMSFPDMIEIGDGAEISDCGPIINTRIWPGVKIEGSSWLCNGSIVCNTSKDESLIYVGQGVNAENFIIEDATVANGVILRNSYVGQGSVLDKGFTSHDSLFFANCTMENGEACSILAGPYTVSMHKGSLLIGCQTSFMNVGSGTNMSNHMYKLGPKHWGVLERGAKTSSNSYIMHGSKIGAFSLVMGDHKKHPDTSEFPFSYLFGDKEGNTVVAPGAMLKSFGLKRDQGKWQKRDRREGLSLKQNDRITFHTFNPYTMRYVIKALEAIGHLTRDIDETAGKISFKGLGINASQLKKAHDLYSMCIDKYLTLKIGEKSNLSVAEKEQADGKWIDLGGQIMPESTIRSAMKADSIDEIEEIFNEAFAQYDSTESAWIFFNFKDRINGNYRAGADRFDSIVESDRIKSLEQIAKESDMLSL